MSSFICIFVCALSGRWKNSSIQWGSGPTQKTRIRRKTRKNSRGCLFGGALYSAAPKPPPLFAENGFRLDGFCLILSVGRMRTPLRHKINSRESVDKEKWSVWCLQCSVRKGDGETGEWSCVNVNSSWCFFPQNSLIWLQSPFSSLQNALYWHDTRISN